MSATILASAPTLGDTTAAKRRAGRVLGGIAALLWGGLYLRDARVRAASGARR
jgi:hypothetical protein